MTVSAISKVCTDQYDQVVMVQCSHGCHKTLRERFGIMFPKILLVYHLITYMYVTHFPTVNPMSAFRTWGCNLYMSLYYTTVFLKIQFEISITPHFSTGKCIDLILLMYTLSISILFQHYQAAMEQSKELDLSLEDFNILFGNLQDVHSFNK